MEGCFYVGASLCCLHKSNIFGMSAVFSMNASHFFPPCVLAIIPLIGGVTGVVVTPHCTALDVEQGLLFALWLSQPCLEQGLLLSWSRSPQICF